MSKEITVRLSTPSDFPELIPFLDRAFGFPSERTDGFMSLLPKLYCPEMTQIIAEKSGEIVGAVGLFERKLKVGGELLTSVGIGNVACRADCRGQGIMTSLMESAHAYIRASGAELSDLGGRRHRYAHFGYECAGRVCNFSIRADFPTHIGGSPRPLSAVPMDGYLTDAEALYRARPIRFIRDDFDAVTRSWGADRFALLDNDSFSGYALVDRGRITELCLSDPSRLPDAVSALINATEDDGIELSLHETDPLFPFALPIYDGVKIRTNEQISVLNFKKTALAYAKAAASVRCLPNITLPLHIHGVAGDELFTLAVRDGEVIVMDGADEPMVLSHHDAIAFLFGLVSAHRAMLLNAEAILPLPIYIPSPDAV